MLYVKDRFVAKQGYATSYGFDALYTLIIR